jgi:hypothetical protein
LLRGKGEKAKAAMPDEFKRQHALPFARARPEIRPNRFIFVVMSIFSSL